MPNGANPKLFLYLSEAAPQALREQNPQARRPWFRCGRLGLRQESFRACARERRTRNWRSVSDRRLVLIAGVHPRARPIPYGIPAWVDDTDISEGNSAVACNRQGR